MSKFQKKNSRREKGEREREGPSGRTKSHTWQRTEAEREREREGRGIQEEKEIGTRDGREDEVERERERKNVWQDGKHDKTGNGVWQWSVRWD